MKPGPTIALPAGRPACRATSCPTFWPSCWLCSKLIVDAEEPLHLFAEAVGVAPLASPPRIKAELAHERGERRAQLQAPAAGADGLGGHPEQSRSAAACRRDSPRMQLFSWSQPGRMESVR